MSTLICAIYPFIALGIQLEYRDKTEYRSIQLLEDGTCSLYTIPCMYKGSSEFTSIILRVREKKLSFMQLGIDVHALTRSHFNQGFQVSDSVLSLSSPKTLFCAHKWVAEYIEAFTLQVLYRMLVLCLNMMISRQQNTNSFSDSVIRLISEDLIGFESYLSSNDSKLDLFSGVLKYIFIGWDFGEHFSDSNQLFAESLTTNELQKLLRSRREKSVIELEKSFVELSKYTEIKMLWDILKSASEADLATYFDSSGISNSVFLEVFEMRKEDSEVEIARSQETTENSNSDELVAETR
ncbi:hypothetical protein LINGRAHAP2_LOCUS5656 [Linum grandiflorum]